MSNKQLNMEIGRGVSVKLIFIYSPSSEQFMPQIDGFMYISINEREPTSLIAFTLR